MFGIWDLERAVITIETAPKIAFERARSQLFKARVLGWFQNGKRCRMRFLNLFYSMYVYL